MSKRKFAYRPVVIEWYDAVDHGSGSVSPHHKGVYQIAVGWLLKRDEEGVSYAVEYSENDEAEWRNENFIPAVLIRKVRFLK